MNKTRRPLIAGNWKLNNGGQDGIDLATAIASEARGISDVDVVVAPPATLLSRVVQAVEKAIRESDLGLNPQVDGDLIRIPVPALSEERRKDLVKVAKKNGEECKVAVRKARHEALDMLSELKESGDASEDEVDRAKKKAEELVSEAGQSIDQIIAAKEKEILAI